MIKEQVTIDEAIQLLNDAVQADPEAMHNLVEQRMRCNMSLAEHMTIQVHKLSGGDGYTVGLLGILNGLFGIDDKSWGAIAAVLSVDCPNEHKDGTHGLSVGDPCSVCGTKLVLGKLEKFVNRKEEKKDD